MDRKEARKYMEMAIEMMKMSKSERRSDGKPTPRVGAVIVLPNGEVETAYRGEFRDGDHAEYTLLDKKLFARDLTGATLFATLEPCAPRARNNPKVSCSIRIVEARIKQVYFGIIDPDPTVASKGYQYLLDNGVDAQLFDADLQDIITSFNKEFLEAAEKRATLPNIKTKTNDIILETPSHGTLNDLSEDAIEYFCTKAEVSRNDFEQFLLKSELAQLDEQKEIIPNMACILLFAKKPRDFYPQAGIKATCDFSLGKSDFEDIDSPLVLAVQKFERWYYNVIGKNVLRDEFVREDVLSFPLEPIREAVINAIVHRDYSITGAKIKVHITSRLITISSPGEPIPAIKLEQLQEFSAPSFSRNPKIAYIFNRLKLMEETGLGMKTFHTMPSRLKLPQPTISLLNNNIVVEFKRSLEYISNDAFVQLNNEEKLGYEYIKEMRKVSKAEYAKHFNFDEKKAQRHLSLMRKLNLIRCVDGANPKTPGVKYEIN